MASTVDKINYNGIVFVQNIVHVAWHWKIKFSLLEKMEQRDWKYELVLYFQRSIIRVRINLLNMPCFNNMQKKYRRGILFSWMNAKNLLRMPFYILFYNLLILNEIRKRSLSWQNSIRNFHNLKILYMFRPE